MPVRAEIRGSQRLYDKWKRMSEVAQGRTLERALTAGALLIQNSAKRRAPWRSGNLRRSIHIGGHEDMADDYADIEQTVGEVSRPNVGRHSAEVFVGTNVEYARIQEYGGTITPTSSARLHFRLDDGTEVFAKRVTIPAQPYLRPAVDEDGRAAQREAVDALAELMRKAMD